MTVVLLGTTIYISSLLSSTTSPTKIQKTKAAAVTYTRKVDLFQTEVTQDPTLLVSPGVSISPVVSITPIIKDTSIPATIPTTFPTLIAMAPTLVPTLIPTKIPVIPTSLPTLIAAAPTGVQSAIVLTPTLQPLLAYKSTSISPTLIPIANTGGMSNPTKAPSPTIKKAQPTGVQQLPETGWIQTSSILFIVATSTILFSLLF